VSKRVKDHQTMARPASTSTTEEKLLYYSQEVNFNAYFFKCS
jgi:hypothetical protein